MWLLTSEGFYSIVEDRSDPGLLLIRSRKREHIENLLRYLDPEDRPPVIVLEDADYRYRISLDRKLAAAVVAFDLVANIDYDNFKNSIKDEDLHDACSHIWWALRRYLDETNVTRGEVHDDARTDR